MSGDGLTEPPSKNENGETRIGPSKAGHGPSPIHLRRIFDHQRWLMTEGRYGKRMILKKKYFENTFLEGVDLSGAVFANVAFSYSNLQEARFVGAEFFNVSFYHCNLERTDFTDAKGQHINFENSYSEKAIFGEGRTGIKETGPERGEFMRRLKTKFPSL